MQNIKMAKIKIQGAFIEGTKKIIATFNYFLNLWNRLIHILSHPLQDSLKLYILLFSAFNTTLIYGSSLDITDRGHKNVIIQRKSGNGKRMGG